MPQVLLYSVRVVLTFCFVPDDLHFLPRRHHGRPRSRCTRASFPPGFFPDIAQAFTGTAAANLTLFPHTPWVYIFIIMAGDILARKKLLLKFPPAVQYLAYAIAVILISAAWMDHYVAQTFVYNKF